MKMIEMSPFSGIHQRNVTSGDDNKNISHCDGRIDEENILSQKTVSETSQNHHANFNATNNTDAKKNDENTSNPNAAERFNTVGGREYDTNLCVGDCIERGGSSEGNLAHLRKQGIVENGRTNEFSTNVTEDNMRKNIQGSAFGEVKDKDCGERSNENREKHGELCGNLKQKSMNLSRKAKSFFRKKSRLAIVDSNCTLILPGARRVRGKQYEKMCGRSKVSQLLRRSGTISANSIRIKCNVPRQGRMNSRSLTNLQADNSFDRPSSIPLETQELLNKNYWEYYRKLKRKFALTKPAKKREKLQDCSPESQTLQQCSMLSCMINTALRDSTTVDRKSLSDPTANVTSNVRENVPGLSCAKKRKRTKQMSKRSLELKTIGMQIAFGSRINE